MRGSARVEVRYFVSDPRVLVLHFVCAPGPACFCTLCPVKGSVLDIGNSCAAGQSPVLARKLNERGAKMNLVGSGLIMLLGTIAARGQAGCLSYRRSMKNSSARATPWPQGWWLT